MAGSVTYRILETPKAEEVALAVIIDDSVMAENPDALPPEGALYPEIDQKIQPQELGSLWNDYRYLSNQSSGDGKLTLIFGKVKSQVVRDTPFRTTSYFGDHRWPPILEALQFIQDNNFPRSTNGTRGGKGGIVTGPSYYARQIYHCEVNEGTRFIEEEFFSDVPYIIPQYPVPTPSSISYDIPGASGSFPECLHPKIIIPPTRSASNVIVLGNSSEIGGGAVGGQVFPATNFETWAPYVLTHQQSFQNGYYAKRVRVFPPPVPDSIVR